MSEGCEEPSRRPFDVEGDEAFEKFMRNPGRFRLKVKECMLDEKYRLTFVFSCKNDETSGICIVGGYYTETDFIIELFESKPVNEGIGRACLRYLHSRLDERGIPLLVSDIESSAVGFWRKMEVECLVEIT